MPLSKGACDMVLYGVRLLMGLLSIILAQSILHRYSLRIGLPHSLKRVSFRAFIISLPSCTGWAVTFGIIQWRDFVAVWLQERFLPVIW